MFPRRVELRFNSAGYGHDIHPPYHPVREAAVHSDGVRTHSFVQFRNGRCFHNVFFFLHSYSATEDGRKREIWRFHRRATVLKKRGITVIASRYDQENNHNNSEQSSLLVNKTKRTRRRARRVLRTTGCGRSASPPPGCEPPVVGTGLHV